jgi:hypothetical protein
VRCDSPAERDYPTGASYCRLEIALSFVLWKLHHILIAGDVD